MAVATKEISSDFKGDQNVSIASNKNISKKKSKKETNKNLKNW